MARWTSRARSWWAKIQPTHVDPLRRALRRGWRALFPHRPKKSAPVRRLTGRVVGRLREELSPPTRGLWLARGELLVLVFSSLFVTLGVPTHARSPLGALLVLAVILFALFTVKSGGAVLLRRAAFAAVLLLLPRESPAALPAIAFATALATLSLSDALRGLRGLPGLSVPLVLPERALASAPHVYALVAAALAAWGALVPGMAARAALALAVWIALATLAGVAGAVALARARHLELGAAPRAWAAALCFLPFALFAGWSVSRGANVAIAFGAAFVIGASAAAHVAINFDALRGVRRARLYATLAVFGTPLSLLLALIAADEPAHRPAITVLAFVVGIVLALAHRQLAELGGAGRSPWTQHLQEARGSSERRHPFEAVTRALERMQNAPEIGRAPVVVVFESEERIEVDRAGYARRRVATFPRELIAVAQAEPFATLREEVLYALEVRRPDLRALLAWLDADDLRSATLGIAEGEPVCALLLPRGQRATSLSLEELYECKRLADTLAGHLAVWGERRHRGDREIEIERRLHEREEQLRGMAARLIAHGNVHRVAASRWAAQAPPVLVAPKSRLAIEALERRAARAQGTFVLIPPGNDALAAIAHAHLKGPRADRPFVVVDGATVRSEASWHDPATSPLAAAHTGALVVQDVRGVPLSVQRWLASALAERRLPGSAEPLDVVLVVTSRAEPARLLEDGALAPELLERLAGAAPIAIPSMAERAEDLRALCTFKLAYEGIRAYGRPLGVADEAFALLVERGFDANEAELDVVLTRACRHASTGIVQRADMEAALGVAPTSKTAKPRSRSRKPPAPESAHRPSAESRAPRRRR